jgi:hypothetical protein
MTDCNRIPLEGLGRGYINEQPQPKGKQMENQHRKISGYRELNETEIALMNQIKVKGGEIGDLVAELKATAGLDQRWISIGATDLQTGLMALVRGVAQPTTF